MNYRIKSRLGIRVAVIVAFIVMPCTVTQSQIVDFPAIDIVVSMDRSRGRFEFFWKRLDSSSPIIPVKVYKLLLHLPAGGPTLWRIISADGRGATNTIVYGIVPAGFSQTIPETGKPPPLTKQQRYGVDVEGERGGIGFVSFIYKGD